MSVNFDPVSSNIRTCLVNSSSSPSASIVPSSSTESSTFYKLIAFPSNSASSSSLSVNSQDNNKNYQHNDQQECLDKNLMAKHCLSESTSPSSSSSTSPSLHHGMTNELRRSLDNRYSKVKGLDQEWYSARKRQLDEILDKLQHLHKLNLDDRENIEGMKKKTIKLIATYSNITMKTNNFLSRWERKHGSKLKSYQSSTLSSSPTPSTFSSSDVYDDKYEPDFLFNTSRAW